MIEKGSLPDLSGHTAASAVAGASDLEQAFRVFVAASQQLEGAYDELQQQVARLTEELAVANGELRRQYAEKAALSGRLQALLEALPAGVVEVDGQGVVQAMNLTAVGMFGADTCGRSWAAIQQETLEPTFNEAECLLRRSAERCIVAPVVSELPEGQGYIVLVHDVTQAHQLQQQLAHHKRLSAMGEMAAVLAHQLRTPLAAALLYVANLQRPGVRPDDVQRFASKAVGRLKHLEKLVQDMLRFVRGQGSGTLESVAIDAVVADAAASVESGLQAGELDLHVHLQDGGCEVLADRQARTTLGQLGRDYAQLWSSGSMAERMLQFYQGMIARPRVYLSAECPECPAG